MVLVSHMTVLVNHMMSHIMAVVSHMMSHMINHMSLDSASKSHDKSLDPSSESHDKQYVKKRYSGECKQVENAVHCMHVCCTYIEKCSELHKIVSCGSQTS